MAKMLLGRYGIEVWSHVVAVGSAKLTRAVTWDEIKSAAHQQEVLLRCADPATEAAMKEEVDRAYKTGDTVGGIFEVVAHGVPAGLGTHANWDERLDGLLAQAVMSLQAVKAGEIGTRIESAVSLGSKVHDQIDDGRPRQRFVRPANQVGGLEGGISNWEY